MPHSGILQHSAKDDVIGSCHQPLIDAQQSLLIDSGLFQNAEPPLTADPVSIA
ncbi:hypothetical protein Pres01_19160 [Metapseudomonas resinovorans]|uniref:hypothetical protein n=1 Tax=Metapseudomonas resinovorans TaxID=53412 RepID=UPI00131B6E0C|nr:hypothetical protein [Pseudomonas resinovorans]GLZ85865.1 hypothetical protein Pres01_19160 [Pseudomonas resinovorans]